MTAAMMFLELNGLRINESDDALFEGGMGAADGRIGVEGLSFLLRP